MATASLWLLISLHDTPRNTESAASRCCCCCCWGHRLSSSYSASNIWNTHCRIYVMRATVGGRCHCAPCANVKHTTSQKRVDSSLENETKITEKLWPPRKVSSDFRLGLLGRPSGCSSGGYSSNEALSKFGRSCRWQLLTWHSFSSSRVVASGAEFKASD